MGNWEGLDRRKFPRINYPCQVVIHSEQDQQAFLTHTENISTGGIGIIFKHNVKLFSPVTIELDLLDLSRHIKCEGKVVWSVRRRNDDPKKPLFYDIGIEFQDLKASDRERLAEIIQKLSKQRFPHAE